MNARSCRAHWSLLALAAGSVLALAGCSVNSASSRRARVPHPARPATPTATVSVAFAVAVTPAPPVSRPAPRPRARPSPTAPTSQFGPYLLLRPNWGQPTSQTIAVHGANLPNATPITLVWSTSRQRSAVSRTIWTGGHGLFNGTFTVPAAPPGVYRIDAFVDGLRYASAVYRVVSLASVQASASPDQEGELVSVHGSRFVPGTRVLLVAYPVLNPRAPVVLGNAGVSRAGSLTFHASSSRLVPGQYLLRVYSLSSITAEMAETYVQVVA